MGYLDTSFFLWKCIDKTGGLLWQELLEMQLDAKNVVMLLKALIVTILSAANAVLLQLMEGMII